MAAKGSGSGKVVTLVVVFAAGHLARKVITAAWKRVTGNEPPTDPHDPDVALREALGWSIVMGVSIEAARLLATRFVAVRMRRIAAGIEAARTEE